MICASFQSRGGCNSPGQSRQRREALEAEALQSGCCSPGAAATVACRDWYLPGGQREQSSAIGLPSSLQHDSDQYHLHQRMPNSL